MKKPGKRARPRPVYVDGTWRHTAAGVDQILEQQNKAWGGVLRSRHADWRDKLFAEAFNAELAIPQTFLVTVLCNDAATALVEISNGGDEADDSGVVLLIVGGSYDQGRTAH